MQVNRAVYSQIDLASFCRLVFNSNLLPQEKTCLIAIVVCGLDEMKTSPSSFYNMRVPLPQLGLALGVIPDTARRYVQALQQKGVLHSMKDAPYQRNDFVINLAALDMLKADRQAKIESFSRR